MKVAKNLLESVETYTTTTSGAIFQNMQLYIRKYEDFVKFSNVKREG